MYLLAVMCILILCTHTHHKKLVKLRLCRSYIILFSRGGLGEEGMLLQNE